MTVSAEQLTNYLLIALIIVIAIGKGISVALDFYIKRMQILKKPVPKQVIDVKDKADWLVSEASTIMDITGAQKKDWATNQLQQTNPNLSDAEARGAIQSAYDKKKATQDSNAETSESDNAQPIGFLGSGDDSDEAKED